MIEFIELNKEGLEAYLRSDEFGAGPAIPISLHRAKSHLKNPCLKESDILLVLAKEAGNLIGYFGILPDTLHQEGKAPEHIGWLSSLWVSDTARGKGLGLKLMNHLMKQWNQMVLSADYVPQTKVIYDSTGQFITKPFEKKGIRLYIKSDFKNILAPKHSIFRKLAVLISAIDSLMNLLLLFKLKIFWVKPKDLKFEYVDAIDDELGEFIESRQKKELFKRGKEKLNWILSYPWVLNKSAKDEQDKKYYFSSSAKCFEYYALKIRKQDKLIGFMLFSQRDGNLKLPYFYHDNALDEMLQTLNYHLLSWHIKTFTTYNKELAEGLAIRRTPAFYKKPITRYYRISKQLESSFLKAENLIQDGDGDCVFT